MKTLLKNLIISIFIMASAVMPAHGMLRQAAAFAYKRPALVAAGALALCQAVNSVEKDLMGACTISALEKMEYASLSPDHPVAKYVHGEMRRTHCPEAMVQNTRVLSIGSKTGYTFVAGTIGDDNLVCVPKDKMASIEKVAKSKKILSEGDGSVVKRAIAVGREKLRSLKEGALSEEDIWADKALLHEIGHLYHQDSVDKANAMSSIMNMVATLPSIGLYCALRCKAPVCTALLGVCAVLTPVVGPICAVVRGYGVAKPAEPRADDFAIKHTSSSKECIAVAKYWRAEAAKNGDTAYGGLHPIPSKRAEKWEEAAERLREKGL